VVISNGKVVEQGTHMELLALSGHYHALVTAQQLNTIDEMENRNEDESGGQLFDNFSPSASLSFSIFIASLFS
jgi:hypothetical protein